ncbi:putative protein KIAA1522 -like protein [Channa argus]|uniref:KIAA1522 n=1 Tax=Channa argus TaxID=215402 RepID=A0A6G1QZX5_CHAAH|nr:putative protein KIAA1522 -like protein [Channa argus]
MMSRRRSTGDLVPRDITEILAREARAQRGQRKPGSSLGQALSWLKGSRRKKSVANTSNQTNVTDAKSGLQNHDPTKLGPKGNEDQKKLAVHYRTSQHYQENVFIEGRRPKYLEDLHTEAQEGLKIQQQEEHNNGVNFNDEDSIASTDTLCPEQDISSKDRGGSPESTSTIGNTDTTVTSAVSTRPVLTRQGSTFKPLNPVKRLDKTRKRSRRTTIMGIPSQVQKELGTSLHKSSTFQPLVSTQLPNQDGHVNDNQLGVVIIPTVDGGTPVANKEGARVHLSELEASRGQQLLWDHLQTVYQEELPISHQTFGSHLCPTSTLRPKSVAVPGMTTSSFFSSSTMLSFLQEPQGPVMSISPQATYLSTIIPNAYLPPSIEVIEIDRSSSRTRGSSVNHGRNVRTISKSSLVSMDRSVSPLLSRRSDGDSSKTAHSQEEPTLLPTLDSVSNWSESQSSKTIVSDSSPISSKGSTHSGNSQTVATNEDPDLASLHSHVSVISSPSSENVVAGQESSASGSVTADEEAKNKCNSTRNLSVMKNKQPPAPPRRTNSLHTDKFRSDTRVLVDSKELSDCVSGEAATTTENVEKYIEIKLSTSISTPVMDSAVLEDVSYDSLRTIRASSIEAEKPTELLLESSHSSTQKTSSEGEKFERTMSPSSGYSSQSGTPTLSPKEISPTSEDKQRKTPIKPERSVSRASSSAASPSSSLTSLSSGTSEPNYLDGSTRGPSVPPQVSPPITPGKELTPNNLSSTLRAEFNELLNIPPLPKVRAPCPPPPETWVHNRHTFELLCGPCPSVRVSQRPTKIQDNKVKQTQIQTMASKEMQFLAEKQTTTIESVLTENKAKPEVLLSTGSGGESCECSGEEQQREASTDFQKQEQRCRHVVNDTSPKKDPPPVMKKPTTVLQKEIVSQQAVSGYQKETTGTLEVRSPVEYHATSPQYGALVLADNSKDEMDKNKVTSMQSLFVEVPKISKVSPPPTPPPAYHPTPPPTRKTPPSSVSMLPDDLHNVQEETYIVESCWPPPPPPLEGDSVFDGVDEVDFPPPPPPLVVTVSEPDVFDSATTKVDVSRRSIEEVGQTVEDSSETVGFVSGLLPDLNAAVPQSVVTDNKSEDILQVLKADTADEISCRPGQNVLSVSDSVPPPSVETASFPANARADNPLAVSALVPSSSFLKRDSVKSEDDSSSGIPVSAHQRALITVPLAPHLPAENLTHGVNFRRQPSVSNRDSRSKEFLLRHRSPPIPKEDANIPLVTPSLLQMVRLRSVHMTADQVKASSEDKPTNEGDPVQDNCPLSTPGPQNIPQKPIRKSLSLKSSPQIIKTSPVTVSTPSMRLQEAIRMKAAAMSPRDGLPARLGMRSQTFNCLSDPGAPSLKSTEGSDMHKSPACTASFIFSRSTKKVVTSAASSPDAQASLRQSLAAELMQVSDQSRAAAFTNGGLKNEKVPPPVAKKPANGSIIHSQHQPACSEKVEFSVDSNGATGGLQHMSGITFPETTATRVTADTIETLF